MIGLRAPVRADTPGADALRGPAAAEAPVEGGPRTIALTAVLRRRWPVALLCALSAAAAGTWAVSTQPATYRSEAVLTVAPPAPGPPRWAYIPAFETARTARDLLGSARVAALASAALGGDPSPATVRERLLVTPDPDGWQTIALDADAGSPAAARALLRAVIEVGVPVARAALPAGSQLEIAIEPGQGGRVARPLAALAAGIVGLALAAGALAALLAGAVEARIRGLRR